MPHSAGAIDCAFPSDPCSAKSTQPNTLYRPGPNPDAKLPPTSTRPVVVFMLIVGVIDVPPAALVASTLIRGMLSLTLAGNVWRWSEARDEAVSSTRTPLV
jgi:hypothetical protein